MLKHALAVLVISAASATSVAAHADWNNGATRYAPEPHVVAPRYCPPVRPAPSAYWAPAPHYAPYHYASYAYYAPQPNHGWRKVWRQQRFDGPGHRWNSGRDWNDGHGGSNWNDGPSRGGHDWHDR